MKRALSRQTIAWLAFTALLLAAALGLFMYQPQQVLDGADAGPGFDIQALPAGHAESPEIMATAVQDAAEAGATAVVIPVYARENGLFAGEGGPSLESVLDRARADGGDLRLILRTQTGPEMPQAEVQALTRALISVIRATEVVEQAVVQALDWRVLKTVNAIMPEIARSYMTEEQPELDTVQRGAESPSPWLAGHDIADHGASVPRTIQAADRPADAPPEGEVAIVPWRVLWAPAYRDLRDADLNEARALGIRVTPRAVADRETMRALIEAGVDGLTTPDPALAREVLTEVRPETAAAD